MADRAIQVAIGITLIVLALLVIPSVFVAGMMITAGYILISGKFPSRGHEEEKS
jgi:hypothetical protein